MASISATKALEKASHRSGKKKGRVYGKKGAVTEERIVAERTALLAERQTQLDSVLDTHDTLVSLTIWMRFRRV
jgi:helicase SWR1